MLQPRFGQPTIARVTDATPPHSLRYRSLHACTFGVFFLEAVGSHSLAPLLERFVLLARANTDTAALSIRTLRAMRTGLTVTHRKLNPYYRIFARVDRRVPIDTGASGWTSRLACLPVNHKIGGGKPFIFSSLSPIIATYWTKSVDLILALAVHQQLGINIAHIGQMHAWQQIALSE